MATVSTRKPAYRKPQTSEQQLASAIDRAQRDHITVARSGAMADGRKFWIVASQSVEGMHHIVSQHGKSLECDCYYSTMRHMVCVHRAAAYLFLRDQAVKAVNEAREAAQPTPAKQTPPAPSAHEQASRRAPVASMAERASRALPADDDKPFSIYKSDYQPVAARAQADRHGDMPDYVPADYKSHEYP